VVGMTDWVGGHPTKSWSVQPLQRRDLACIHACIGGSAMAAVQSGVKMTRIAAAVMSSSDRLVHPVQGLASAVSLRTRLSLQNPLHGPAADSATSAVSTSGLRVRLGVSGTI
jgi:hypothetical protein